MRVRNIKLTENKNTIKISATCKIRRFGEDEIYFKFDKKYKSYIDLDMSSFAAALFIPSMRLGEDLVIDGTISEKLYKGMKEIMRIMICWNMGLKPINIVVQGTTKDKYKPKHVAEFFSGGVDSFYTYLKHKKEITHFILVNGYDIDLRNKKLWQLTRDNIREIAKKEKIELIEVESNIEKLIEPILLWEHFFGGCLAAIALLLRKKIKSVYVSAAFRKDQLFPSSSHYLLDKHWGTESLSYLHYGIDVTRMDKMKFVSSNQLILDHLRVCYLNKEGIYNCGVCDKCLRTMIALEALGKLKRSKTFPNSIDLNLVKNMKIEHEPAAIYHRENLAELKRRKINKSLQTAIEYSLNNFYKREAESNRKHELILKAIYFDHMYAMGKFYKLFLSAKRKL